MAERVILHIGSMKSGTSFVQNVLGHNRASLAEHGISFAGQKWRDQVKAVQDIIGQGGEGQPPLRRNGPWRRLVKEIDAWQGTAVVSMEFLAPRNAAKIELIRDSFEAPVDVVLTGRDLARNITAMWLESVQNGSATTWEHYLEAVRAEDRGNADGRAFWRHQGLASIADRWSHAVGPEHFTLVTVPQKGAPADLLWTRFASLLGIDPATCSLGVRANPSIGLATALVLRELNEELAKGDPAAEEGTSPQRYHDLLVKHLLTKRALARRHAQEPRLGLDARWVLKRGTEEVRRLREAGHRVIGDLDELVPRPVPGVQPSDVSLEERHAAAMEALTRMVQISARREDRNRRRLAEAKETAQR